MIKGLVFSTLIFSSYLVHAQTESSAVGTLKPRLVILTDISIGEPDDHESLIRLLVHADQFEIEGIVITTGWSMENVNDHEESIDIAEGVIDAYEKDLPNLLKRSNQNGFAQDEERQEIGYWPSVRYLRERTVFGSRHRGMSFIGEENNSEGSDLILQLADEDDDRPIWVTFWGGGNTLAQSIWQVEQTRSKSDLKAFLNKIRVYAITDQDRPQKSSFDLSSHSWMRREFSEDLFFIWDECAWKHHNQKGRSNWSEYVVHIQDHGHLGKQYPKYKYGVEGDTPSFLHLLPTGLNDPDQPTQAGWGGYFEKDVNHNNAYSNQAHDVMNVCNGYADYFYPAAFNNFAARMDWAKNGKGNRNPIVIIDGHQGIAVITKTACPNTTLTLDASATFDPEGDALSYQWWIQPEAGSFNGQVALSGVNSSKVEITVPANAVGKSFHIICEVTDQGSPPLTSYRRIIIESKKQGN